jgi:hypothetical protein
MSRFNINQAERRQLLFGRAGPVVRKVTADTRRCQSYARVYAPVDQGPLRSSISADVQTGEARGEVRGTVGSRLPYAIWQEDGTGIYGPRGVPIRPKRARFLRFIPKGGNDYVFARQVRGVRPQRYLRRALALVAAGGGYSYRAN